MTAAVFTLPNVHVEVHLEVLRATEIHGDQLDLADGTNTDLADLADQAKAEVAESAAAGQLTWLEILMEEAAEAAAEVSPLPLRTELIQVAATAIRWLAALDVRHPLTVRHWDDPVLEERHFEVRRGTHLIQTVTVPAEELLQGTAVVADPHHPGLLRIVRPEVTP
jgi:hypothetical protein